MTKLRMWDTAPGVDFVEYVINSMDNYGCEVFAESACGSATSRFHLVGKFS